MVRRRKRRGGGGRYVGLEHYMMNSLAWAGREDKPAVAPLSPEAKALLVDVWKRHNGMNNGEISYAVREAEAIGLHRNTATRGFAELVERGFLKVRRNSAFTLKTREARTWELTAEPTNGEPATKDFMRWTPSNDQIRAPSKNKTRSLHRDRQSLHRDREARDATKEPITVPPQGPSAPESAPSRSLYGDTSILPSGEQLNRRATINGVTITEDDLLDSAKPAWTKPTVIDIPTNLGRAAAMGAAVARRRQGGGAK